MPRSVLGATLRDRRRGLIGWLLGMTALTAFVLLVYETLWQSEAVANLVARFPPTPVLTMLGIDPDMLRSGAGFVQTQFFAFIAPLLILIYAIGFGASATTREEDDRTADLLLSLPLRRERVIFEKFVALALLLLAIVTMSAITLGMGNLVTGMSLPLHGILAATSGLVLIGLLHGTLALAVGAGTGSRALAASTAGTLAVVSFVLQGLVRPDMEVARADRVPAVRLVPARAAATQRLQHRATLVGGRDAGVAGGCGAGVPSPRPVDGDTSARRRPVEEGRAHDHTAQRLPARRRLRQVPVASPPRDPGLDGRAVRHRLADDGVLADPARGCRGLGDARRDAAAGGVRRLRYERPQGPDHRGWFSCPLGCTRRSAWC